MNYNNLIDRFWRLDDECHFTAAATRLYLMLIDHFNRVGFDRNITWTNGMAMEHLGISLNAYLAARDMLVSRGLLAITLESGRGKRSHRTVYTLPTAAPQPATSDKEPPQPAQPEPQAAPAPEPETDPVDPENVVMDFDRCAAYLLSPAGEDFRRQISAEYGIDPTAYPNAFKYFREYIIHYGQIEYIRKVRTFKRMFIKEYCDRRNHRHY